MVQLDSPGEKYEALSVSSGSCMNSGDMRLGSEDTRLKCKSSGTRLHLALLA